MNKKNIVCIDDEEAALETIVLICKYYHDNVNGFQSPVKGLEYIKENKDKIDLIFLDVMMHEMNGVDVLKELKNNSFTRNIPVVMNSCISDPQEIKKVKDLGAARYLNKPFNKKDIFSILNEYIA